MAPLPDDLPILPALDDTAPLPLPVADEMAPLPDDLPILPALDEPTQGPPPQPPVTTMAADTPDPWIARDQLFPDGWQNMDPNDPNCPPHIKEAILMLRAMEEEGWNT
jgi:hypothetical protein